MSGLISKRPAPLRRRRSKITPSQRAAGGETRVNKHWRVYFLQSLAQTSCVRTAAQAAEVAVSRAYKARREEADFRRDWLAALEEGYAHLEQELLASLRGAESERKLDVANALRLLAHHSAAVSRQRAPDSEADPEERAARTLEDFIRRVRPAAFAALPEPGGEDAPAA